MIIVGIPLIVAIVGLLMYVLASNAKVSEAGRIAFFAGLFVALLAIGGSAEVRWR